MNTFTKRVAVIGGSILLTAAAFTAGSLTMGTIGHVTGQPVAAAATPKPAPEPSDLDQITPKLALRSYRAVIKDGCQYDFDQTWSGVMRLEWLVPSAANDIRWQLRTNRHQVPITDYGYGEIIGVVGHPDLVIFVTTDTDSNC